MNTFFVILQLVLAFVFINAGIFKAFTPKIKLEKKIPWVTEFSGWIIKFSGHAEIVCALALFFSYIYNLQPTIAVIASFFLALEMIFEFRIHYKRKETDLMISTFMLLVLILLVGIYQLMMG